MSTIPEIGLQVFALPYTDPSFPPGPAAPCILLFFQFAFLCHNISVVRVPYIGQELTGPSQH